MMVLFIRLQHALVGLFLMLCCSLYLEALKATEFHIINRDTTGTEVASTCFDLQIRKYESLLIFSRSNNLPNIFRTLRNRYRDLHLK